LCKQCGKAYTPRRGELVLFNRTEYCSHVCANRGRRLTFEDLYSRIVIDRETGCHIWKGPRTFAGYGVLRFQGRKQMIHRIVWEHFNGPVPDDLELDHLCRVTSCCNVEHLRMVTHKVNVLASDNLCAVNARRTNCPKCGEPYTEHPTDKTRRYCKPCAAQYANEYARRRRSEDPDFRSRQVAALERYRDKLKNQPEAINVRARNENCPKCGGTYSTFPNGARYCKPCRNQWQRDRDKRIQEK
jgi:hypothetical protein